MGQGLKTERSPAFCQMLQMSFILHKIISSNFQTLRLQGLIHRKLSTSDPHHKSTPCLKIVLEGVPPAVVRGSCYRMMASVTHHCVPAHHFTACADFILETVNSLPAALRRLQLDAVKTSEKPDIFFAGTVQKTGAGFLSLLPRLLHSQAQKMD